MLVCARISISITTCTRKPSNCLQLRCSSQTSIWQMSGTQEECSTGEQLAHDILNPTEASETADQDEDHNKVKRCECSCSKCCEIVLKADSQMVGSGAKKGQLWICNQCNALACRIRRMSLPAQYHCVGGSNAIGIQCLHHCIALIGFENIECKNITKFHQNILTPQK